jgi:magnesium-transporting ATPase (P-type)
MVIDATLFTPHLLLFRSNTSTFLRMEMVRGLANSAALVTVLLFLDRDPLRYVELLLINVVVAGICLAATSVHVPPSLTLSSPMAAYRLFQTSLFSRQLVTLLSAKGIETGSMIALSQFQLLSPILSLKIGIAVSSALSANARAQRLPVLWLVHCLVYGGGTAAIVLINTLDLQGLPIPETMRLITLENALFVLPIVLSIFTLTVIGLRLSPSAARPVVESSADQ